MYLTLFLFSYIFQNLLEQVEVHIKAYQIDYDIIIVEENYFDIHKPTNINRILRRFFYQVKSIIIIDSKAIIFYYLKSKYKYDTADSL